MPRLKLEREKEYLNCIDCKVLLDDDNTDYVWQRRCTNCTTELRTRRHARGLKCADTRQANNEVKILDAMTYDDHVSIEELKKELTSDNNTV